MIVVSDTSPLTALLTVAEEEILPKLFEKVIIPAAVFKELQSGHTSLPPWIEVQAVQNVSQTLRYASIVDIGEAEAIVLAQEIKADHLLIDERKGRRLAVQQGVPIIGLLGVVLMAKKLGFISSARSLLGRLQTEAGIYLSDGVREAALKSAGE